MNRLPACGLSAVVPATMFLALAPPPAAGQLLDSSSVVTAQAYLSVDAVRPGDRFRIAVALRIRSGWHVNSATPSDEALIPTKVTLQPLEGFRFAEPQYPPGQMKSFSFTEAPISVYEGEIVVFIDGEADESVLPGRRTLNGTAAFQPCNDASCLAPAAVEFELPIAVVGAGSPVRAANAAVFSGTIPGTRAPSKVEGRGERFSSAFARSGLVGGLALAFVVGLALNLTPCVYPLISVTVSFFGGQAGERKTGVVSLAAFYVIGIVLSYSILGTVAAATHEVFGFLLQSSVVLVLMAVLIAALAASMWGLFEIPTPAFISRAAQSKRGMAGAFVMGLTMGLVSAPCIGPFIVGLLAYVAQVGNLLLGFFLFFAMSLGLGVPYLFLAAFSGSIDRLPRSGMWMVWVKKVFAVVLLGVAAYFVKPIVGPVAFHIVLATLAAAGGVYLGLIYRVGGAGAGFRWVRVGFVVAALATAVYLGRAALPKPSLEWEPYTETAVAAAAQDERPVMIYFTAEWCLPCDELKRRTFANERVRAGAQRFVRLKVDLTHETPEAARKYRVVGPPTVVFIDRSGQEREGLRIEGFVGPDAFLSRMREAAR